MEDKTLKAEDIIKLLHLEPLPGEGGFYRETYRSAEAIEKTALPARYNNDKHFSTAIYFLLTSENPSLLHRLPSDELFHFYLGDPVTMLHLHPGGQTEVHTLGLNLAQGQRPQCLVPKGVWQGAYLAGGSFALMGTTTAPAFDFVDLELGNASVLIEKYPKLHEHPQLLGK